MSFKSGIVSFAATVAVGTLVSAVVGILRPDVSARCVVMWDQFNFGATC